MNKFKFNTRTSKAEAQLRSLDLVDVIKSPTLTSGVETQVDLDAVMPTDIDDPYPVVILINGTGGCGKGTLIKQIHRYSEAPVYELSTVDPIRPVAKDLIKYQQDWWMDLFAEDDRPMSAADEEDEKGGPYRQLLRDIKVAWSNHGDGPNVYAVGATIRLIEDRHWTVGADGLPYCDELGEFPLPAMIFVNVREPENLTALKEAYWELGLLCITMKMEGIVHDEKDLASSDLLVDNYAYDLVIRNKGTIDDLSVLAFTMSTFIRRANRMYGISVAKSQIDPMDTLGHAAYKELMELIPAKLGGVFCSVNGASSFDTLMLVKQIETIITNDPAAYAQLGKLASKYYPDEKVLLLMDEAAAIAIGREFVTSERKHPEPPTYPYNNKPDTILKSADTAKEGGGFSPNSFC